MLIIKLFRVGKKHQPSFKIVVSEKGTPASGGRFVEQIGFYNPITKEKIFNAERIKYWISVGAQPSATVHNLFVSEKLIDKKKIDVHKKPKKKEEEKASADPKATAPAEVKEEAKPAEEPKEEVKETPKEEKKEEVKPVEEKKEEAKIEEKPAEQPPAA